MMGNNSKNTYIFCIVATFLLGACGSGGSTPPDNAQLSFGAPVPLIDAPVASLTAIGTCGALPGNWEFHDLATDKVMASPTLSQTPFAKAFRKSWGGTTTALAAWRVEAGDKLVWNEGRQLHVDQSTPLVSTGMIESIALTGTPGNMTALLGTDLGLVIADMTNTNNAWTVSKQVSIGVMGAIRSVAITSVVLEKGSAAVPLVFMVANDSVLIATLDSLRAGGGCIQVAYQAKDHPADSLNPADKRSFHPIKVAADSGLATFLTATRLPEDFADGTQLKTILKSEWTSFQSTAFLIDVTRKTPMEQFITVMGNSDRFFASDLIMSQGGAYLFGNRYTSNVPANYESGIATYDDLTGTPVVNDWMGVSAKLAGDYRMGRIAINQTTAYIRALDRITKVELFSSGPTQQKWTAWSSASPVDYVREVTFQFDLQKNQFDPKKPDELDNMSVETPRYVPGGPKIINWDQKADYGPGYIPSNKLIGVSLTDVDVVAPQNQVLHQHLQDSGSALLNITTSNNVVKNPFSPRVFHVGDLLFFARHSANGPYIYVYKDNISGVIDTSDTAKNPAIIGFWLDNTGKSTKGAPLGAKAIAAFEDASKGTGANIGGQPSDYRIDDIQEIANPLLPQFRHFATLIHTWDGLANVYRVVILQMNLTPVKLLDRTVEIQGCSDFLNADNNFSNNVAYGKVDVQPKFMGQLQLTSNANNILNYEGNFQHYNPTYNVWHASISTTADDVVNVGLKSHCKDAGELIPIIDGVSETSVGAVLSNGNFVTLLEDGTVRWKTSPNAVQYVDVGKNMLGGAVSIESGQVWAIAGQYMTRMDTIDGLHPVALFTLDGSSGSSCPLCQFTDSSVFGNTLITSHPERGAELYDFTP